MDKLHEETDEPHNAKPNSGGHRNFLELLSVRLGASFDETDGVLGELPPWFNECHNLIHF